MITAIVFSKNRASQLELFLESVDRRCPNLFDIHILWDASNDKFKEGYDQLWSEYPNLPDKNKIHKEVDFELQSKVLIDNAGDFVTMIADDNIFYKPLDFTEEDVKTAFDSCEFLSTISMRYGTNTHYQ